MYVYIYLCCINIKSTTFSSKYYDWLTSYAFLTLEQQLVQSKQHCYLLVFHCRLLSDKSWFCSLLTSSNNFFFSSNSLETSSWAEDKQERKMSVSSFDRRSCLFSSDTLSKAASLRFNSSLSNFSCVFCCLSKTSCSEASKIDLFKFRG